jgi:hypothetical protein
MHDTTRVQWLEASTRRGKKCVLWSKSNPFKTLHVQRCWQGMPEPLRPHCCLVRATTPVQPSVIMPKWVEVWVCGWVVVVVVVGWG